jgi:predicted DNA-binding transcriptional regulator AlpA
MKSLADLISEREAAERLNLSVRTLQGMRVKGGGPAFVKLTSRRVAYSMAALEAWVTARTRASTSDRGAAA